MANQESYQASIMLGDELLSSYSAVKKIDALAWITIQLESIPDAIALILHPDQTRTEYGARHED